eukprot:8979990-Alexandrium_andersonii.AAC.1
MALSGVRIRSGDSQEHTHTKATAHALVPACLARRSGFAWTARWPMPRGRGGAEGPLKLTAQSSRSLVWCR